MELRKHRKRRGFSQSHLARISGVDLAIINRLESGAATGASYTTTVRLARALGLEPEELEPVDFPAATLARRRVH